MTAPHDPVPMALAERVRAIASGNPHGPPLVELEAIALELERVAGDARVCAEYGEGVRHTLCLNAIADTLAARRAT